MTYSLSSSIQFFALFKFIDFPCFSFFLFRQHYYNMVRDPLIKLQNKNGLIERDKHRTPHKCCNHMCACLFEYNPTTRKSSKPATRKSKQTPTRPETQTKTIASRSMFKSIIFIKNHCCEYRPIYTWMDNVCKRKRKWPPDIHFKRMKKNARTRSKNKNNVWLRRFTNITLGRIALSPLP